MIRHLAPQNTKFEKNERPTVAALPWRRIGLNLLIVAAGICLYLGITEPIIKLTQFYVFTDSHSLSSAVYALHIDGEYFLAGVVLFFSILLPTIKLTYLFILAVLPEEQLRAQQKIFKRLEGVGKWSMHDVLILSITIVYLKSSGLSKAVSMPGARYFALSVILIMIAYGWIKRTARDVVGAELKFYDAHRQLNVTSKLEFSSTRRFWINVVTLAAAVSLVLGITLPTIKLTKLYVWTDEHSIISAIWALYRDNELFLAALIFLFSIIFPALKLFYLIVVTTLATRRPLARDRIFSRLEWLGKWSMMDVLVLALIIFYVNASAVANANALPGIYYFTAAVFLTMFAYALVKSGVSQQRHYTK